MVIIMDDLVTVKMEIDGITYNAIILTNYTIYDKEYCIYAIKDNNGDYDIYYGRIINDILVPGTVEDADINYKIVSSVINAVKY